MQSTDASKVFHLVAAGHAARYEHGPRLEIASGGQQSTLADLSRHIEMLADVSERASHPATTRV
jgi:hypothetical protein